MKKEGKHITRWKTGATKLQGAAYLREMAEQGWILEDMNHLTYSFREDEPQYLKYRLEELEHAPTGEELAEYEKDGWKEVCHYELEYIFVKEREPFEEDIEENKEEIIKDLEQKIELEETTERRTRHGQLIILGIGLIAAVLILGFSKETLIFMGRMLIRFLPWMLIAYFASRRRAKELRQEQDRVREGDISDDYMDWRRNRRTTVILILVLLLGFGVWVFYASDFNEKTFDMPAEISYKEIPAVRLENLVDEPLTRMGESIDPDMEGIRLNADIGEGSMYEIRKNMGAFENYGVDHRWQLRTKKQVETKQCMMTADGVELHLDTEYYHFRDVQDATRKYLDLVRDEVDDDEYWKELGVDLPERQLVVQEKPLFYDQHICKEEWSEGIAYHIVCSGNENQIMELNFYYSDGNITEEQLLREIEKVFTAQVK